MVHYIVACNVLSKTASRLYASDRSIVFVDKPQLAKSSHSEIQFTIVAIFYVRLVYDVLKLLVR